MAQTHLPASSALEHYYENYLGVGKTRAKRNETEATPTIIASFSAHLSARLTAVVAI